MSDAHATETVTSKDAQRNWSQLTDKAMRRPVVITTHGRPRHVLMAYDDFQRLRGAIRQAYRTQQVPDDLATDLLDGMSDLRAPLGRADDDTVID